MIKPIKMHPWLYRLDADFRLDLDHLISESIVFDSEWLTIKNGFAIVKAGYAWDGCSYKFSILDLFVVGVPDGRLRHGKPMAYYASLIHDALTQYRREIPITRTQATGIFNAVLKESGFFWRPLYVLMVKLFGQHGFLGDK